MFPLSLESFLSDDDIDSSKENISPSSQLLQLLCPRIHNNGVDSNSSDFNVVGDQSRILENKSSLDDLREVYEFSISLQDCLNYEVKLEEIDDYKKFVISELVDDNNAYLDDFFDTTKSMSNSANNSTESYISTIDSHMNSIDTIGPMYTIDSIGTSIDVNFSQYVNPKNNFFRESFSEPDEVNSFLYPTESNKRAEPKPMNIIGDHQSPPLLVEELKLNQYVRSNSKFASSGSSIDLYDKDLFAINLEGVSSPSFGPQKRRNTYLRSLLSHIKEPLTLLSKNSRRRIPKLKSFAQLEEYPDLSPKEKLAKEIHSIKQRIEIYRSSNEFLIKITFEERGKVYLREIERSSSKICIHEIDSITQLKKDPYYQLYERRRSNRIKIELGPKRITTGRLNLKQLSVALGLQNYKPELTRQIELNVLTIFKDWCGFDVGKKSWIRSTNKIERISLLKKLKKFTDLCYPELTSEQIEIIIRRGLDFEQQKFQRERRHKNRQKK